MTHDDIDNSNLDIKCSDCVYKCTKEVTMKKHMKSDKNIILENSKENIKNNNEKEDKEYLEDDYFQIEIVNGETVYACTICDEGLDSVEEVRNHVKDEHREVVSHIISDEKIYELKNYECKENKIEVCNDDKCLKLTENKCLCYYDEDN